MVKSIAQVSEELGVSKASIYKKLKDEKYKKLIIKENGKMMINEELLEKLRGNRKKKQKVEIINNVEIIGKEELKVIENDIYTKDNTILKVLLDQIKEKDIQISKLYDLIESNQVIIKRQQEKDEEQSKLEEHFKEIDRKLSNLRDSKKNNSNVKNFFKFLGIKR